MSEDNYREDQMRREALQLLRGYDAATAVAILSDPCLRKLKPGEPFFVVRAQDQTAVVTVQHWLRSNPQLGDEKRGRVIETQDKMKAWPAKKPAD